ncbi:hypothetical protein QTO34_003868, partial [Cnephaeus nilssonii]
MLRRRWERCGITLLRVTSKPDEKTAAKLKENKKGSCQAERGKKKEDEEVEEDEEKKEEEEGGGERRI